MRVLLVEPDADYVEVIRALLSRRGWETVVARSGEQAIEKAKEGNFALAIVDSVASQADGTTVIEALHKTLGLTVIGLVDQHAESEAEILIDHGASYDLCKPFTPAQLRAALKAVLQSSAAPRPAAAPPGQITGVGPSISVIRHEVTG